MTESQRPAITRDERLWGLTGTLIGVALFLATDQLAVGLGVGLAMAVGLAGQERARRSRRTDPSATRATPKTTA